MVPLAFDTFSWKDQGDKSVGAGQAVVVVVPLDATVGNSTYRGQGLGAACGSAGTSRTVREVCEPSCLCKEHTDDKDDDHKELVRHKSCNCRN